MVDFNALRARKGTNFQALQSKLEKTGQNGGFKKDERIWKPVAKDNKSSNIIRFLMIPFVDMQAVEDGKLQENDLTPMAKILAHQFQGPKGWFIEKSLQTFGEDCPVRKYDGPIWGTAKKNDDKILQTALKKRLPGTTYYANILVIKDGTNPENNGKVMLYEFGETVRKLIEKCSKPEFETDPIFDPFDAFEGADLMLNLTYVKKKIGEKEFNVAEFGNVKWANQKPLADGNEVEIERLWKAEHSIADFYDRKHFKTFEALEEKYLKVMDMSSTGTAAPASKTKSAAELLNEMTGETKTAAAPAPASAPAPSAGKSTESEPLAGDDDSMAEFEKLLMA